MSDDQARINFNSSRKLKLRAKSAISSAGYDSVQNGFLKVFELGVEQMEKQNKEAKK